jgi:hypothetical protein
MQFDATTYREIPVYGLIPLSQGLIATVDVGDFLALSEHKWSARRRDDGKDKFYAVRGVGSARKPGHKIIRMHRWLMDAGDGVEVDHVNGDGLDNRRGNLRFATSSQQKHNRPRSKNNASGFKGVSFDRQRKSWKAAIMVEHRYHFLGRFKTAEEAARAYDAAATRLHGEFAHLNFPSHTPTGAD